MSLELWYEDNAGDIVLATDRVRADTLEVTIHAAEGAVGESQIIVDDPDADFYIRGHKPLYLIESEATDDEWAGVIGIFYSWNRVFRRGPYLTGAGREVVISAKDVNTLLTRRLQKGTDAERPQETDVERMTWLIGTPEVVGGGGKSIEETGFFFTDSPYQMDKTDYTAQDSAGVVNDALQDSGKNAYLYNASTGDDPMRLGIWYGRTERADYSSAHRISNDLADIDPDTLSYFTENPADLDYGAYTFAPSIDAELDRDPSRVASGVMVQFDGGYAYETRPSTAEAFDNRDMLMQAELVKTQAQAVRRANRYLRDLRNEDDAISCSVLVPAKLVNGFKEGQRVQVRFTYLPGYAADFVWLRIAARTVRQINAATGLYEIALDLRAEEPPDSATTGSGLAPCSDQTASTTWYPLGGTDDVPNNSNGHIFYWNPGLVTPITVQQALDNADHQHWHFPEYGAGGAGSTDYAGDCSQNRLRVIVDGNGTLTIQTATYSGNARTLRATLYHHRYGVDGDLRSGIDVLDLTGTGATGDSFVIPITTHGGQNCTHWVDVTDVGGTCGSKWGWSAAQWVAS